MSAAGLFANPVPAQPESNNPPPAANDPKPEGATEKSRLARLWAAITSTPRILWNTLLSIPKALWAITLNAPSNTWIFMRWAIEEIAGWTGSMAGLVGLAGLWKLIGAPLFARPTLLRTVVLAVLGAAFTTTILTAELTTVLFGITPGVLALALAELSNFNKGTFFAAYYSGGKKAGKEAMEEFIKNYISADFNPKNGSGLVHAIKTLGYHVALGAANLAGGTVHIARGVLLGHNVFALAGLTLLSGMPLAGAARMVAANFGNSIVSSIGVAMTYVLGKEVFGTASETGSKTLGRDGAAKNVLDATEAAYVYATNTRIGQRISSVKDTALDAVETAGSTVVNSVESVGNNILYYAGLKAANNAIPPQGAVQTPENQQPRARQAP